jgi:hypothetical protein
MKQRDLEGRGIVGGPRYSVSRKGSGGRKSRVLSVTDRRRLRKFRDEHGRHLGVSLGIPELKCSMSAPFSWETLQRALAGKPIWESYHEFIVSFLDRHVPPPPPPPPLDWKARASGEREEESAEPIHRGSR